MGSEEADADVGAGAEGGLAVEDAAALAARRATTLADWVLVMVVAAATAAGWAVAVAKADVWAVAVL